MSDNIVNLVSDSDSERVSRDSIVERASSSDSLEVVLSNVGGEVNHAEVHMPIFPS